MTFFCGLKNVHKVNAFFKVSSLVFQIRKSYMFGHEGVNIRAQYFYFWLNYHFNIRISYSNFILCHELFLGYLQKLYTLSFHTFQIL